MSQEQEQPPQQQTQVPNQRQPQSQLPPQPPYPPTNYTQWQQSQWQQPQWQQPPQVDQSVNVGKSATSGFIQGFAGCLGVGIAMIIAVIILAVLIHAAGN